MKHQRCGRQGIALAVLAGVLVLPLTAFAGPAQTYGEGVTLEQSVPVSAIYEHADQYLGEDLRVEGRIIDVCRKRGHWMELAGDREFQTLRVEVEPGAIVFPADSKGKYGIVEGTLERVEYTLEETRHLALHKAIEAGEEESFDEASVTEPMTLYILHATGATIDDRPAPKPDRPDAAKKETQS
jgi:hypothetical protein